MTATIIIGAVVAWFALSIWAATVFGRWMAWVDENRQ